MKACRKCGREQPLSEYYRHHSMKDGRVHTCKTCQRAYQRGRPRAVRRTPPPLPDSPPVGLIPEDTEAMVIEPEVYELARHCLGEYPMQAHVWRLAGLIQATIETYRTYRDTTLVGHPKVSSGGGDLT
jgi:hypothetical protein